MDQGSVVVVWIAVTLGTLSCTRAKQSKGHEGPSIGSAVALGASGGLGATGASGASSQSASPPAGGKEAAARAALERLRSQGARCEQFEELGPQARAPHGPAVTNPCGAGVRHVRCVDVPAGFFVPVSVDRETCVWNLWFVPRAADKPPVRSAENYEEFDLAFTEGLISDDFEGKGTKEVLVTRGYEHAEGVASGTSVLRHLPDGRILDTGFDVMRDVDGDGLLDGIVSFETQITDVCRIEVDVWARLERRGIVLTLHRSPDHRFSLTDQVAVGARAASCRGSDGAAVVRRSGRVDDDLTTRRALCQVARGRPRKEVWAEIERQCRAPLDTELDCPKQRPFACGLLSYLPAWLERVEALATPPAP